MQAKDKHYHGWILTIEGSHVSFEPIEGTFEEPMKCRRQATKEASGDGSKVLVLLCRGEDSCPSKLEGAALAN